MIEFPRRILSPITICKSQNTNVIVIEYLRKHNFKILLVNILVKGKNSSRNRRYNNTKKNHIFYPRMIFVCLEI